MRCSERPPTTRCQGVEHWTRRAAIRLFLWEKFVGSPDGKPVLLFVHGSSMASQPTFDLTVPGRPDSSVMDWFAQARLRLLDRRHGRLRPVRQDARHPCDIANGADDLAAATDYMRAGARRRARSWPTASRRARCARRCSRSGIRAACRAWRSMRSSGPAKARPRSSSGARSCRSSSRASGGRSTARSSIRSSRATIPIARSRASSMRSPTRSSRSTIRCPTARTSTCARSCRSSIPRAITMPTLVLRGQYDGIAAFDDLIEFFKRLPNPGQAVLGDGRAYRTRASSRRTT